MVACSASTKYSLVNSNSECFAFSIELLNDSMVLVAIK